MKADDLPGALGDVRARIEAACARAGRDPAGVEILPITKTVPVERLQVALTLGLMTFGENLVQEAEDKAPTLPSARWAMVGHLQSNKAARAIELFSEIQSVDSVALAERLARVAADSGRAPYPISLQVNVDDDPAKAGFDADELVNSIAQVAALESLRIEGLMTVGRLAPEPESARPTFRRLRELSASLRKSEPMVGAGLSMGMSDDFEVAVEEGATVVRLGRVLFGARPVA